MSAAAPAPVAAVELRIALQPIVALGDERVFAYEALTRVRGGGSVAELFDRATERGSVEPNLVAVANALKAARTLPESALLFVNADPIVLATSQLPAVMRRDGYRLSRVVLEITERAPLVDLPVTARVLEELRAAGVRFALDDFASAHSHLTYIDVIRPSFLKIGHGFGGAFEASATRTAIVRHVAGLAGDFGCATILEGVESAATAAAARDLGIEYAQGYYFGYPMESIAERGRLGAG